MFGVNSKSYPTSISTIMLHMGPCSCRGTCLRVHALALRKLSTPFNETTRVFHLLQPLAKVDFPPFVDNFHLEMKVILDQKAFVFALVRSPHFSFSGPSSMMYELLRNCFVLDDSTSGFNFFFKVCGHIVQGHVPPSISCLFFAS